MFRRIVKFFRKLGARLYVSPPITWIRVFVASWFAGIVSGKVRRLAYKSERNRAGEVEHLVDGNVRVQTATADMARRQKQAERTWAWAQTIASRTRIPQFDSRSAGEIAATLQDIEGQLEELRTEAQQLSQELADLRKRCQSMLQ